jgi:hypothetical protein
LENPPTRWWSAASSRIARVFKRETVPMPLAVEDPESIAGNGFLWLHQVAADPVTRDLVREHYGRRRDGQHIEFLLAFSSFEHARNPLQRFEQLRHLICRYVHPSAGRAVQLSEFCRGDLLEEWERWAEGNRVPVDVELPALQAAVFEVRQVVEAERATA